MPFSITTELVLLFLVITAFIGSFLSSKTCRTLALKWDITDDPKSKPDRKKQNKPIPLLGGTGFSLVAIVLMAFVWLVNKFNWFGLTNEIGLNLEPFKLAWILVALVILLIGGFVDDKYKVSGKIQLISIHFAIFITIFGGGLTINSISYNVDYLTPYIPFASYLATYIWLLFCTGATKFLDGHDGLVSSVGIIGLLAIASVSMLDYVNQPMIFIFAIIWIASIVGFLPFNFPDAKLYLGEGGSEVIGFIIGILAILSGAKIATASAVIGWFIMDLVFVWFLRIIDKRNPLSSGDRLHWHFRMLDLGMSKVAVLALTTLILIITTQVGLLLQTAHKPFLILGQVVFFLIIFSFTEIVRLKKDSGAKKS